MWARQFEKCGYGIKVHNLKKRTHLSLNSECECEVGTTGKLNDW